METMENIAENWLAENDPLYGKKRSLYLTANCINKVLRREKPTKITGNLLFYRNKVN